MIQQILKFIWLKLMPMLQYITIIGWLSQKILIEHI